MQQRDVSRIPEHGASGVNTFLLLSHFTGFPGRSVAQCRGEHVGERLHIPDLSEERTACLLSGLVGAENTRLCEDLESALVDTGRS